MKILVTGAGGLVGRAVAEHCTARGDNVTAVDHRRLDISEEQSVRQVVNETRPDAIINCAAWTDVDGCESDPRHAERANARGPELLAAAARGCDSLLVTISTDYVFDGTKQGFYTQRDQPNPISIYGRSKLAGERRAQSASAHTIVVRTGYIFGAGGKNFLSTFLNRARQGEHLKAISDMVGTPTYAPDLAVRLRRLTELDLPGTYHVVNSGDGASFESFARTGLRLANFEENLVETVTLADLNRPAPRPRNSRMSCLLSPAIGLDPLPDWRAALRDFVSRLEPEQTAAASPPS